jgi:hypothetical protein
LNVLKNKSLELAYFVQQTYDSIWEEEVFAIAGRTSDETYVLPVFHVAEASVYFH